jgi:YesN/AraC family two-component response regulator
MNGYELVQNLKKHPKYAPIPTVMLTALSGTDDKLKALRVGIDDYLTKPFDDDELKARIANLLQNQAERRAYLQEVELEEEIEQSEVNSKDLQWLEELEIYLNGHLRQSLSVEIIASEMNVSRKTLYTKIKSLTGLTPAKYINEIRYEIARRLIEKHGNWTVKAIALEVGFKDEKNFSRNFKKRFGRNPSEYLGS